MIFIVMLLHQIIKILIYKDLTAVQITLLDFQAFIKLFALLRRSRLVKGLSLISLAQSMLLLCPLVWWPEQCKHPKMYAKFSNFIDKAVCSPRLRTGLQNTHYPHKISH